jgi:hypothetical protein
MKKLVFPAVVLICTALFLAACSNPNQPEITDTRTTLTAGSAVSALASAITANVTFTGASGLTLSTADFEVSAGGTITVAGVASDTATVTVTFPANLSTVAKTYTVSIASGSTLIKGSATVDINQAAAGSDTRTTLTAGSAVSAAGSATTANVTFTGASEPTLNTADFEVTTGGTITNVGVAGVTATITVTFAANTASSSKTYTVSIAAGSPTIKGTATVTITQVSNTQVWKFLTDTTYTDAGPFNVVDENDNVIGTVTGGNLTLILPTLTAGDLELFTSIFENPGATINPSNAKGYLGRFELDISSDGYDDGVDPAIWFGTADELNEMHYMYSDRNVTIAGTTVTDEGDNMIFDLSLTTGWNQIWRHFNGVSTYDVKSDLTGFPSGAKWYIDL